MEALSPTMEEGRLVKWVKPEGSTVANGDVLAEVETDKAIMELVARGDGVLRKQLLAEGASAPIGTVLGVIAAPSEDISALVGNVPPVSAPTVSGPPVSAPAVSAPVPPIAPAPAPTPTPTVVASEGERVRSSPLARRLAAERGIDLHAVAGSGPNGRVVKRDLDEAKPAAKVAAVAVPAVTGADYTDIPLTQIRKTIARRLAESIGPVPTFYLTAELDV